MEENIEILERPEWISFTDIHCLLSLAHEKNRKKGIHVKTAEMAEEDLKKHIGEHGKCFVAVDGVKLVGVTAVRIVKRNGKLVKGKVADQILIAVHPEYRGKHISSLLHEKVVEFARDNELNWIELRTADKNYDMQAACLKWGFQYVDMIAFPAIDHYTVVMMKWLADSPSEKKIKQHYMLRKLYTKLRYKPGMVKRFGI